jgi:DHA1 family bicyclomycin/chloramphenicol resistance-like MFS transporter
MVSFDKKIKKLKFWEFVSLAAFTMSLVSLSIDAILPAFAKIGEEFGIAGTNAPQLTISLFFLGFAFGQIIYGPLSDSMGRKPPIYAGFIIFIIGSLVSFFAGSFKM